MIMPLVYLYTSPTGKKYVGQTVKSLSQRWSQHVYEAKNKPEKGCSLLNKAINKYGSENFKTETLIECNSDELDDYENFFIDWYDTIVPNGYNCKSGGSSGYKYTEELKKKMSISLRKNNEDKKLPMYVNKINRNGKLTYRIKNHPKCANKTFKTSEEAEEFIKKLENNEIEPILKKPPRPKKDLPKYIMRHSKGYTIEIKGKYIKSFVNPKYSNEENLKMAKEYLEEYAKNNQI